MNKKNLFLGIFSFLVFAAVAINADDKPEKTDVLKNMPENVKAVISAKCFGCHSNDAKNDKSKEKLNFSTFGNLSLVKKIAAYGSIVEVMEDNEMPPKKFLERFPDKKISDKEQTLLLDWAKKNQRIFKK